MDGMFVLAVVGLIAWWFYKSGKRTGSRKGVPRRPLPRPSPPQVTD